MVFGLVNNVIINHEKKVIYHTQETMFYHIAKQREESEKDNTHREFLTSFKVLGIYM